VTTVRAVNLALVSERSLTSASATLHSIPHSVYVVVALDAVSVALE
jgi:hypothetical protein